MIRLRVRDIAESRGLSISKLSRMSDVDIKTTRRVWNHPETTVTTITLDRLSKALNVPASELLETLPDDPEPNS